MRNVMIRVSLVAAALLAAAPLAAQAEVKIAAIRTGELILQSPQYKASSEKMKQEFDKRGKDLEADAKKFQEDAKKFQKEADLMATSERARQEKELQTRQIDLGYRQRQLQEDVQARDRQLTQEMRTKIQQVIQQVAKEKGYDLVVQDPLFASPAYDVTDDVLKKLQAIK